MNGHQPPFENRRFEAPAAAQPAQLIAASAGKAHGAERVFAAVALEHLEALRARGPGRRRTLEAFGLSPATREAEA